MRFLIDENMPGTLVRLLRERGHDVLSVKESLRGWGDQAILARAQKDLRLIVTQDKDFGCLAFSARLPASCGIILFRPRVSDPDQIPMRMLSVLENRPDWEGMFAVVTENRIRIRPLSAAVHPENVKMTETQRQELDVRLDAMKENPDKGIAWEDAKDELRKKR